MSFVHVVIKITSHFILTLFLLHYFPSLASQFPFDGFLLISSFCVKVSLFTFCHLLPMLISASISVGLIPFHVLLSVGSWLHCLGYCPGNILTSSWGHPLSCHLISKGHHILGHLIETLHHLAHASKHISSHPKRVRKHIGSRRFSDLPIIVTSWLPSGHWLLVAELAHLKLWLRLMLYLSILIWIPFTSISFS